MQGRRHRHRPRLCRPGPLAPHSGCPADAYNTAKDAPGSYVGVPDDFSKIPMDLLVAERYGVAATYRGDRENAMAGAGECAQRIEDTPKVADVAAKIMADAEAILTGLKAKYVVD